MKTSIIIPTCSNPSKLERLLSSIPVYKADSLIKQILIVDDSSDEKSKTENKRIAQTYPSTLYINKEIFESIFPTYRSDTQNSPSNFLKLGTSGWNLPNARNIGGLVIYSISEPSDKVICFDDDLVFEESNALNKKEFPEIVKNTKPTLSGFRLQGCPDLSRLEWIELYAKTLASKILKKNQSYKPSTAYVSRLANLEQISEENIRKYTNLLIEEGKPKQKSALPQRRELSGGAFMASIKLFKDAYFPEWFDEDWTWFNLIREKNQLNHFFMENGITHLSDKKDVLVKNALEFEEHGKILTNTVKATYPEFQYSKMAKLVELERTQRIDRISNLIKYVNDISKKTKEYHYQKQLAPISTDLTHLLKYLENYNIAEASQKIKNYTQTMKQWPYFVDSFKQWAKKNEPLLYEVLKT